MQWGCRCQTPNSLSDMKGNEQESQAAGNGREVVEAEQKIKKKKKETSSKTLGNV